MAKELVYIDRQDLVDTADALRERLSTTDTYGTSEFANAVRDIQSGVDTSDANAIAEDIVEGKSAYVNGVKIDGVINDKRNGHILYPQFQVAEETKISFTEYGIRICGQLLESDGNCVIDPSTVIGTDCKFSEFGTVQPESVLAGETFTSSAGLKRKGTLVVNKYYTGSSEPSSSLGNNGDFYLMTVLSSDDVEEDNPFAP